MINPVSRTEEINKQLEAAALQQAPQNEQQHIDGIVAMTEAMEDVRREYRVKELRSQLSAANVVVNT